MSDGRDMFTDAESFFAYTATSFQTEPLSIDPELLKRIDRMERGLEQIMERLAILNDPNPEKLAQHKILRDAYVKYKFLEKLCGQEDDES